MCLASRIRLLTYSRSITSCWALARVVGYPELFLPNYVGDPHSPHYRQA